MGWGDVEGEAPVKLLPPPGTQGAPGSLDGKLITPALSGLGGVMPGLGTYYKVQGAPPALPPPAGRGRGRDVRWPHAAERK